MKKSYKHCANKKIETQASDRLEIFLILKQQLLLLSTSIYLLLLDLNFFSKLENDKLQGMNLKIPIGTRFTDMGISLTL